MSNYDYDFDDESSHFDIVVGVIIVAVIGTIFFLAIIS